MVSKEIILLLKKYNVTSNIDFDCSKWSLEDKRKLIHVLCSFYNSNTNGFIRNIIKTHNLQVSKNDLERRF